MEVFPQPRFPPLGLTQKKLAATPNKPLSPIVVFCPGIFITAAEMKLGYHVTPLWSDHISTVPSRRSCVGLPTVKLRWTSPHRGLQRGDSDIIPPAPVPHGVSLLSGFVNVSPQAYGHTILAFLGGRKVSPCSCLHCLSLALLVRPPSQSRAVALRSTGAGLGRWLSR